jgi:hypothetical protein
MLPIAIDHNLTVLRKVSCNIIEGRAQGIADKQDAHAKRAMLLRRIFHGERYCGRYRAAKSQAGKKVDAFDLPPRNSRPWLEMSSGELANQGLWPQPSK